MAQLDSVCYIMQTLITKCSVTYDYGTKQHGGE